MGGNYGLYHFRNYNIYYYNFDNTNKIVTPQAQVYIVERLGTFYSEWSTGPHFLVPFLDRVAKKVSIKDQIVDFKPQSVITKDNVSMQIDTVVFFQVTDAKQYAYGVERSDICN